MIQRNLRFRANSESRDEQRSVAESFAQSIIWGGKIVAEEEGRVLLDFTDQLLKDVHGVADTLARTGQGSFSVDKDRSAVYLERCKSFPDNSELEAWVTFQGKKPGNHVQQTSPTADSVSLRLHHSFVRLPDNDYRPRKYDVRCPSMAITFSDYATALDAPLEKRWILRHRLVKKQPDQEISEPIEPIVYYVDRGAPAQIQKALIEGASWWNEAFEAAGFKNAFQVKVLPEGADPLDVRYNMIQWVHRSTRGWSYGSSVRDPRTGEIIKGHVTLGSLRVRQDRLLFEGLGKLDSASELQGCGANAPPEIGALIASAKDRPVEIALARIRQLSAHEVGHTLGFVHNFAASTYGDRASVMDYPAPRVKVGPDDELDFSDAYGVGIGSWDKIAVRYAYAQFPEPSKESAELDQILKDGKKQGMRFITDSDSIAASASHPYSNLWDNGEEPIAELRHLLNVRQIALKKFDSTRLPKDTTAADIEQYLVPIYLYHRYQIQAVGKLLGGYDFGYGYANVGTRRVPIPEAQQGRAVEILLQCIENRQLAINADLSRSIVPQPQRSIRSRELFQKKTGRQFDTFEPARILVDRVLSELLNVARLNRVSDLKTLTQEKVLMKINGQVFSSNSSDSQLALQLDQIKQTLLVDHLMRVVDHAQANAETSSAAIFGVKKCPGSTAELQSTSRISVLAKPKD